MRRAKTIDELYAEAEGFDAVLCNDAALATALNSRIGSPRIGTFAATPIHIAMSGSYRILGERIWDDLRIVSYIADETGYDMRFVHGEIENIRTIRRYTKSVERHISGRSRTIYKVFKELPTLEKAMDAFDAVKEDHFTGKKVAIIGLDLFNDLDKHFIPSSYEEIDMFTDGEYEIEKIYAEGNDRRAADGAADLIDPSNAADFAIVLDTSSPMADAVRAALYRRNIPFKNELAARDLMQVRDYLEILDMSLSYDTLKAGQVRELFVSCGGSIPLERDGYLLSAIEGELDERSQMICKVMRNVRAHTFGEVCDSVIISTSGKSDNLYRSPIKALLGSLGAADTLVSDEKAAFVSYTINTMDPKHNEEIPKDEKQGTVLIDCRNSVYADRPAVIYLGMGQNWYRPPQGRRYIDWEDERERSALRFEVLLQQGTSKVYIVNSMKNGKPPRPCVLFDSVTGKTVKEFGEISSVEAGGWHRDTGTAMLKKQPLPSCTGRSEELLFTKTSFNAYSECPRKFMFGRLVRTAPSVSSIFGSMIHEFAEFCLCYPSITEENGLDHYADLMLNSFTRAAGEERRQVERCRIKIALSNIWHFIRSLRTDVPLDRANAKNSIMEHHLLNVSSSAAESGLKAMRTPLYGKFDLLTDDAVFDYKTGRQRTSKDMQKAMNDPNAEHPEYQPLIYLAILGDRGAKKKFRAFNVLGNPEAALNGTPDPSGCFTDACVYDGTFEDYVKNDLKDIASEISPKIAAGWNGIADRMAELGIPRTAEDWTNDAVLQKRMGDVSKTYKKALKDLASSVAGWAADSGGSLTVFQERMNEFRGFVKKEHSCMSRYRSGVFPINAKRCDKCEYFGICTASNGDDDDQ